MKLQLPTVTAIALTGLDFDLHNQALKIMMEKIDFGGAKIIWDTNLKSINDWNKAIIYDLWKYVDTEHAFLFHADGYITNPELWNPEWLKLDYIGAPWPLPTDDFSYRDVNGQIQRVGNSVSLRSQTLLRLPSLLNLEWKEYYGYWNEDGFICCHNRHIFEDYGCKFATFEQALHFGKEHELPENKDLQTFCFHQAT